MIFEPDHSVLLGWETEGECWHTIDDMDKHNSVYCGFWHGPTAKQRRVFLQPQHRHSEWTVDVEAHRTFDVAQIHMERAFKTREKALAWFNYVTWCIEQLTPEQIDELCDTLQGRMT